MSAVQLSVLSSQGGASIYDAPAVPNYAQNGSGSSNCISQYDATSVPLSSGGNGGNALLHSSQAGSEYSLPPTPPSSKPQSARRSGAGDTTPKSSRAPSSLSMQQTDGTIDD